VSNSKIRDNMLIKLTLSRESTNRLGIYDVFVADNEKKPDPYLCHDAEI
jgi:hypothetical protein